MDRRIVCLRIPAFEIELARLEDPALRSRPVAVAAAVHARAVLREVSVEAEQEGLATGMPVDYARWLCPSVQLLPPSGTRIRRGQHDLQEIVNRFAPTWEPVSPGHFFLDLTGTQRLFGAAADAACRIGRELVQRNGLASSLGVGTNKLVTEVATTLVQPAELYDVRPGNEAPFMAPLAPRVLPELSRPAARPIVERLQDLNLSTLGAIADVPVPHLHLAFGSLAADLHRHAQGIDHSPVLPGRLRPWHTETLTLEPDTVDMAIVERALFSIVERLGRGLRDQQVACRRIRLTVVHSDYVEVSRDAEIDPETCCDPELFDCARTILPLVLKRRVRVRRLILEATIAPGMNKQLHLFHERSHRAPQPERSRSLSEALDRIRKKFGERALIWGRSMNVN